MLRYAISLPLRKIQYLKKHLFIGELVTVMSRFISLNATISFTSYIICNRRKSNPIRGFIWLPLCYSGASVLSSRGSFQFACTRPALFRARTLSMCRPYYSNLSLRLFSCRGRTCSGDRFRDVIKSGNGEMALTFRECPKHESTCYENSNPTLSQGPDRASRKPTDRPTNKRTADI